MAWYGSCECYLMIVDVFRSDPKYVENEAKYEKIKRAILGGDSDDEEGGGDSGSEGDTEEGDDSEEERCVFCNGMVLPLFQN